MARLAQLSLLAAAIAAGTVLVGWPAVPLVAGAGGLLLAAYPSPFLSSALAGALGWTVLIVFDALTGEAGRLAASAGGVLGVPGWSFVMLTILFAALLAGCAAVCVRWIGELMLRRS